MGDNVNIAGALDALHTSEAEQLEKAYGVLHGCVNSPIKDLTPKKPVKRECRYTIYDIDRIAKFNPDVCRVVFAGDPRIGEIFNGELENLIHFFNDNPNTKKYADLLFQHDSVLALLNSKNIMQFVRRMPLTAVKVISKNKRLLHSLTFNQLLQIIQLVPSSGSTLVHLCRHLITDVDKLQTINRMVTPRVMKTLLTPEVLGGLVKNNKILHNQMIRYSMSKVVNYDDSTNAKIETDTVKEILSTLFLNQTTESKLIFIKNHRLLFYKLRDKNPMALAELLRGNLDICADILTAVTTCYSEEKKQEDEVHPFNENEKTAIARSLIKVLNKGIEENDIQSVLDMAQIHFGLPPLFVYRDDERHYQRAKYYIGLAKSLTNALDPCEQPLYKYKIVKLEIAYKKRHKTYLKQHPKKVIKFSLDQLKLMNWVEKSDFDRYLRNSGLKDMIINEFLKSKDYEKLIRFALNNDEMREWCEDSEMADYWNRILDSLHLKPDERAVLGYSFRDVMGAWLYDHYQKWEYAGEPKSKEALAILDKAIEYGSAWALYRKHRHLVRKMRQGKLEDSEKTQLLDIAETLQGGSKILQGDTEAMEGDDETLQSDYWTFGFVVAGVIYMNFSTYGSKNQEEARNYILMATDCSRCAQKFENHPNSKQFYQKLGTNATTTSLLKSTGINFTTWEDQQKSLFNLMGFPEPSSEGTIPVSCGKETRGYQLRLMGNFSGVEDPYQNLRVPMWEAYCKRVEDNLNDMHSRVQQVCDVLSATRRITEKQEKSRLRHSLSESDITAAFKRAESTVSRRLSFN